MTRAEINAAHRKIADKRRREGAHPPSAAAGATPNPAALVDSVAGSAEGAPEAHPLLQKSLELYRCMLGHHGSLKDLHGQLSTVGLQ